MYFPLDSRQVVVVSTFSKPVVVVQHTVPVVAALEVPRPGMLTTPAFVTFRRTAFRA